MSGALSHTPADIIRRLLVNLSLGTLPSGNGSWPVCTPFEPDSPDDVITVRDTDSAPHSSFMNGGQQQQQYGFQIRVRSNDYNTGWTKAEAIRVQIDEEIYQSVVSITTPTPAESYLVHCINRTSAVLPLGRESPTSHRYLFTINAVASIRQL